MLDPDSGPYSILMPSFETAARSLKVVPIITPVHSDVEIETAIIALGREWGSKSVRPVRLASVRRVGWLTLWTENDPQQARRKALRDGLAKLGWFEDRNLRIDVRLTTGDRFHRIL